MRRLRIGTLGIWCLLSVILLACGSQPATDAPPTTPLATTVPLQAVEDAIWAANGRDYDRANQLLDVSAVAESPGPDGLVEYWDWITSKQRVADITIEIQETKGGEMRLFIVLKNDNYPTQQVGFWIRWQTDRWAAFEEGA